MSLLRTALHLLLAVVLVINGVAGVAMAAAMTRHDATAVSAATATSQVQGGCHESVKQAAAANKGPADSNSSDCCADGRCACACVHHGTVVMAMLSPMAVVVAWPTVSALDVAAAPSAPIAPQLRPPIALIS